MVQRKSLSLRNNRPWVQFSKGTKKKKKKYFLTVGTFTANTGEQTANTGERTANRKIMMILVLAV